MLWYLPLLPILLFPWFIWPRLWARLAEGGEAVQCGWITDRFGVSWQIIPTVLLEMISDPDPERSRRVMEAMLPMVKLDIARLRQAYDGR